jgi:hypothetical protein
VLLAEVVGEATYLTAFRRSGSTMHYGCTCPYFAEGLAGCKHQWALVREATESALVRSAAECSRFEPSVTSVFGVPLAAAAADGGEAPEESLTAMLARSVLLYAGRRAAAGRTR